METDEVTRNRNRTEGIHVLYDVCTEMGKTQTVH